VKIAILSLSGLCLISAACSQPKNTASQKHYPLTGTIVSIDAKEHTANVDGAAIPDYMAAMKMDYPIASAAELASLKVGEHIAATVNVSDDGSYSLSGIHENAGAAK